jgi:hypothetical protein
MSKDPIYLLLGMDRDKVNYSTFELIIIITIIIHKLTYVVQTYTYIQK